MVIDEKTKIPLFTAIGMAVSVFSCVIWFSTVSAKVSSLAEDNERFRARFKEDRIKDEKTSESLAHMERDIAVIRTILESGK